MNTGSTPDSTQAEQRKPNVVVRYLPAAARILLGLVFFVFGLNGFFNFIPQPKTPIPEGALAFAKAMMATGYLFKLLKGTETLVGLLLLLNRFAPLALVLIAPVIVNIFAFHLFLEPSGVGFAAVLVALEIFLVWSYRKAYGPLFTSRATPTVI